MLDVFFVMCNLVATFVFLYAGANLSITATAELIQWAILGRGRPTEGLDAGELLPLVVPLVSAGLWLFTAWVLELGMIA